MVFFAFRIMVGLGFLMAGVGLASLVLRRGGRLYHARVAATASSVAMAPAGFIALLCRLGGHRGRAPAVHRLWPCCAPRDSVSPIGLPGVATSLAAFAIVYLIVYGAGFVLSARADARGRR